MKRFASHYLYAPDTGFLKQQVVEMEVKDKFCAYFLFPFDFTMMQPVAETRRRQLL